MVREAAAAAYAQRVATVMLILIVAAMCVTTLLTVGRTVSAEAQVQGRLEKAGSRQIRLTDVADKGFLTPAVVQIVAGYDSVERVVGVDAPIDVVNSRIGLAGERVPG